MKTAKVIFAILAIVSASLFIPIGANAASCVSTQALTEGPYYSIDSPSRSDITAGQSGIKTKLTITVLNSSCKPVKGAKVDIWHANASGKYSAVEGNTENFLRGTQVTNASGKVTFTTIYPGWYPGRTMHIHFKVWKNGQQILTSQFFASDANNAKIYGTGVYAARGNQDTPLTSDRIYGELSNPASLTLKLAIGSKIAASAKIVIP